MKTILTALLFSLVGFFAYDVDYVFTDGAMEITGDSTIHKWSCGVSEVNGGFSLETPTTRFSVLDVDVSVDVPSIECSKGGKMNKLMRKALKAGEYQTINFAFSVSEHESNDTQIIGAVTIAGTTQHRAVTIERIIAREDGGGYIIAGYSDLLMTDFGVKPPTALLGTIKTDNEVRVTFLVVGERK